MKNFIAKLLFGRTWESIQKKWVEDYDRIQSLESKLDKAYSDKRSLTTDLNRVRKNKERTEQQATEYWDKLSETETTLEATQKKLITSGKNVSRTQTRLLRGKKLLNEGVEDKSLRFNNKQKEYLKRVLARLSGDPTIKDGN